MSGIVSECSLCSGGAKNLCDPCFGEKVESFVKIGRDGE
jgi:hypothetical protein